MQHLDKESKTLGRRAQIPTGRQTTPLGLLSYSGSQEDAIFRMPGYTAHRQLLQDPENGQAFFMLGYDGLGTAPLAPGADSGD